MSKVPGARTYLSNFRELYRHNKGVWGLMKNLVRMDSYKFGQCVGTDKYGNKYYQNDYYFYGRNRWVEYDKRTFLEYDASMVPAEWHNWLHYICDDPPTVNPRVTYKWMSDHRENLSGTDKAYVPYSTTQEKISTWIPPDGKSTIKIGPVK